MDVPGGLAVFDLDVRRHRDGRLEGGLTYRERGTDRRLRAEQFDSLTVQGRTATLSGRCRLQGQPCTFSVTVQDRDERGHDGHGGRGHDSFTIAINGEVPRGGALRDGRVEIRD